MKEDCKMWLQFLNDLSSVARPFINFDKESYYAEENDFFSDASKGHKMGLGVVFGNALVISAMGTKFDQGL